jgi:hypothetical protein
VVCRDVSDKSACAANVNNAEKYIHAGYHKNKLRFIQNSVSSVLKYHTNMKHGSANKRQKGIYICV